MIGSESPFMRPTKDLSLKKTKKKGRHFDRPAKVKTGRKPGVFGSILRQAGQYCKFTSIHGLKYIVMAAKRRKFAESTLWAVTCSACVASTVILSFTSWQRYSSSPTLVSLESTSHPVWSVPFPAVTLCNVNKVHKPAAIALAQSVWDKLGLNMEHTLHYLKQLPLLIRPDRVNLTNAHEVAKALREMGYGPEALMMKLNPPCESLLVRCRWLGEERNCTDLFKTIKAMEGFCCSFNYHGAKEQLPLSSMMSSPTEGSLMDEEPEDMEDDVEYDVSDERHGGHHKSSPHTKHGIRRVSGAGQDLGLSVMLDCQPQNYFASAHSFYGTKVLVHDPTDFPETTATAALVFSRQEAWISVAPSVVESTGAVRGIEVSRRQCLFEDELQLSSAEAYSYQTCITECRARNLAKLCNCLPFYYPLLYNLSTCTLLDVPCLRKYKHVVASTRPPVGTPGFESGWDQGMECSECMPACTERAYAISSSLVAPIVAQRSKFASSDSAFTKLYNMTNRSVVHVYFNDFYCIKYRRDAVMTWDGLLAAIGGIFGLCLGGSAISIVELLYFFTVGLWGRLAALGDPSKRKKASLKANAVAPWGSHFLE
ncbi:sodium channel protein Nach-like [Ischnura elegans]|uniref:sodium channel protein Nach-like n=1 Tax=Ischnura elegans TaxID=197161 RepID=UPI001ED88A05|nr:sodium channel protein Nach-like [Ischnura elegans]